MALRITSARSASRLVEVVQQLSLARDLAGIMAIVRCAARELTGADGATFVLRDGDRCHYADEDAIAPLWKGLKFPLEACISGWAMIHRRAAVIGDIYADARIPHDAYRPTFVKSLAMVPIRTAAPIGAIGNYWAERHEPTHEQVALLQALADSTSVAMENVQLYADLERRVRDRTAELAVANQGLEAFSYTLTHDLRAPLRTIQRFSKAIAEDHGEHLDAEATRYLDRVGEAATRMSSLIDEMLRFARAGAGELMREPVNVSALARTVVAQLVAADPERAVDVRITDGITAHADRGLLRIALENLLGNAWKFTRTTARPRIELACANGEIVVSDNGAGFDPAKATDLFAPFQRMHTEAEFEGHGVGLATVHRIVRRHGGDLRADAAVGRGATFAFTLAAPPDDAD